MDALLRDDPQPRVFDHGVDLAGDVAGGGVGLDDRESTLDRHGGSPLNDGTGRIARRLIPAL